MAVPSFESREFKAVSGTAAGFGAIQGMILGKPDSRFSS